MKITEKSRPWQIFSTQLNKLWLRENALGQNIKKDDPRLGADQFKSWSSAKKKPIGLVAPGPQMATLNLKVLEKFVKATAPHISYQGFIASHLQHDVINGRSARDSKKSLAIERMVALVEATIADVKKIELHQISHNKG